MLSKVKTESENWSLDWLPHYAKTWIEEIGWKLEDITAITIDIDTLSIGESETGYERFDAGRYWIITVFRGQETQAQMFERTTGRKAYMNVFTGNGDYLGFPQGAKGQEGSA